MIWNRIVRSNFIIKLRHWEYWPFGIVHFPVMIYFLWLSVRSRSFLFFSASNPGIPMGGMFGESKFDILKKIPQQYLPETILINLPTNKQVVLKSLADAKLRFPVIFKPDLGERGYMVKKIDNEKSVDEYITKMKINFIAQELVDLPIELGVFYMRYPMENEGKVTSVVKKEMLTVIGDGKSTLKQLILKKDRAKLQWNTLSKVYHEKLDQILLEGKAIELVSIGNHCLGTKFLDAGYLINNQLSKVFDEISSQIEGFFFGRFDLRCANVDDLYSGKIKIMELNGCGAEPAHIYNPGYSFIKAVLVLIEHWHNIFVIARENRKNGTEFISLKDAHKYYKAFKAAIQQ